MSSESRSVPASDRSRSSGVRSVSYPYRFTNSQDTAAMAVPGLPKPTRNVVLSAPIAWRSEKVSGRAAFNQLPHQEKGSVVGYARGLLNAVRHNHDGVVALQFEQRPSTLPVEMGSSPDVVRRAARPRVRAKGCARCRAAAAGHPTAAPAGLSSRSFTSSHNAACDRLRTRISSSLVRSRIQPTWDHRGCFSYGESSGSGNANTIPTRRRKPATSTSRE